MLHSILYIFPVLILLTGLIVYFVARTKKNKKMQGIGVGIIVCLVVLELPEFTEGFIRGYTNGVDM